MASQKKIMRPVGWKLQVMQIADLQEIPAISPDTLKLMNAALDREKPDLVVFTGDQIKGYGITFRGGDRKKKVEDTLHRLLEPVVRRNIPFAPLFGNHDGRWAALTRSRCRFISVMSNALAWTTRHYPAVAPMICPFIPTMGKKFFLTFISSIHTVARRVAAMRRLIRSRLNGIAQRVTASRRKTTASRFPPLYSSTSPCQSITTCFYRCRTKTPGAVRAYRTHKNESYILNPDMVDAGGFMRESPAIPDINTGEFDAIAEKGDVMAMFVGHDHINSFVGHYQTSISYTHQAAASMFTAPAWNGRCV